jgi:photosystem II stability/assembly factor-like uncharacterized protein
LGQLPAAGQEVYRTTNYGTTWDTAGTIPTNGSTQSLVALGTNLIAGVWGCPAFGTTRDVYVSDDSGATWTRTFFGLYPSIFIIHGSDVFALAPSGGGSCGQSGGMFRTTDNGASWTNISIPSNYWYHTTLVSDGTEIYAGSLASTFFGSFGGVFRSTDDGTTWQDRSPGLSHLNISSLVQVGNNLFAGTSGGNVFTSTDDGINWRSASVGLTDPNINSLSPIGTNLFAGTNTGLFLTTNSGLSWNQITNGLPPNHSATGVVSSGSNLLAGVSGFPGTSGVYISADNGLTWSQSSLMLSYPVGFAIVGTNVFAALSPGGVFLSTDHGSSWTDVTSNLPNNSIQNFGAGNGNLFVYLFNVGVFRSMDNGANWTLLPQALPFNSMITFETNIFAGAQGGVYLSADNGDNWTPVNDGLPFNAYGGTLVTRGDHMFAGISSNVIASGVYRRPLSEMALTRPILVFPEDGSGQPLSLTLRWRSVPSAMLYTAQVATDAQFSNIVVEDTSLTDTSRAIGPLSDNTLYYWRVRGRNNTLEGPFSLVGYFRTVGSPPAQVQLSSPEHGASINADTVDCYWFDPGVLVTHYWFERSLDSLFSSPLVDSTLTTTHTVSRDLVTNTTYWWRVRAKNIAGWGPYSGPRNFTVIITDVAGGEGLPTEFSLKQNYPNPFNPSTIIAYDLPSATHVTLAVYDVLGREIQTLVNESHVAGRYNVEFAATGLASGMYLYRITAGEFVQTRKLLLLR